VPHPIYMQSYTSARTHNKAKRYTVSKLLRNTDCLCSVAERKSCCTVGLKAQVLLLCRAGSLLLLSRYHSRVCQWAVAWAQGWVRAPATLSAWEWALAPASARKSEAKVNSQGTCIIYHGPDRRYLRRILGLDAAICRR